MDSQGYLVVTTCDTKRLSFLAEEVKGWGPFGDERGVTCLLWRVGSPRRGKKTVVVGLRLNPMEVAVT